jgi:hypothetical protein
MKKLLMIGLILLGVAFVAVAVYYWMTPAGSLPHFVPGYEVGVTSAHLKHGLAALILGLGCGVLAWFVSGGGDRAQSTSSENTEKR